jgi:hypothetical protein
LPLCGRLLYCKYSRSGRMPSEAAAPRHAFLLPCDPGRSHDASSLLVSGLTDGSVRKRRAVLGGITTTELSCGEGSTPVCNCEGSIAGQLPGQLLPPWLSDLIRVKPAVMPELGAAEEDAHDRRVHRAQDALKRD